MSDEHSPAPPPAPPAGGDSGTGGGEGGDGQPRRRRRRRRRRRKPVTGENPQAGASPAGDGAEGGNAGSSEGGSEGGAGRSRSRSEQGGGEGEEGRSRRRRRRKPRSRTSDEGNGEGQGEQGEGSSRGEAAASAPGGDNDGPSGDGEGDADGDGRKRRRRRRRRRKRKGEEGEQSADGQEQPNEGGEQQASNGESSGEQAQRKKSRTRQRKPRKQRKPRVRARSRSRSKANARGRRSRWSRRLRDVLGEMLPEEIQIDRRRAPRVEHLQIRQGLLKARVRNDGARPFAVQIRLTPLSEGQWERVEQVMAARPALLSDLLARRLPAAVEDAFEDAGLSLLPSDWGDYAAECNCSHPKPCVHMYSTFRAFGDRVDRDPFSLFLWRGRTRQALLARLRLLQQEGRSPSEPLPSVEPLGEDVDEFWSPPPADEDDDEDGIRWLDAEEDEDQNRLPLLFLLGPMGEELDGRDLANWVAELVSGTG